jgi:membrane protease YdiL (CAAX protease family)
LNPWFDFAVPGAAMNGLSPVLQLAQAGASVLPVNQLQLTGSAWFVAYAYLALVVLGFAVDLGLVVYILQKPGRWRDRAVRVESRPWSFEQGAFLLLVLMALYFASTTFQRLVGDLFENAGAEENALRIVVQSVCFYLIGLGTVALSLLRRQVTWRDAFGLEPRAVLRDVGKGAVFYLAALPFIVFYSLLYQAVLRGMGCEIMMQEIALVVAGEQSFWMRLWLVGLAVVLAPLFEEILFRGIGLPLLARKWGVAPAVVAVSVIFAAVHFHLPSMMPLFVVAVAFSLAYIQSGSIVVPIVMHALFNGVNVAMLMMLKGL